MIGWSVEQRNVFARMVLYLAAYLFMKSAPSPAILFSLRTGSDRISDYAGLYQKDPLMTPWV